MEFTQEEKQAWDEVAKAADIVIGQNNRLYNAIKNVCGEQFIEDLKTIDKEWNFGGGFFPYQDNIVRKTSGKYEKYINDETGKSLKSIKGFWVDEYEHGGMEGDSWSGYVYIKLKNNRYLKTHYSL